MFWQLLSTFPSPDWSREGVYCQYVILGPNFFDPKLTRLTHRLSFASLFLSIEGALASKFCPTWVLGYGNDLLSLATVCMLPSRMWIGFLWSRTTRSQYAYCFLFQANIICSGSKKMPNHILRKDSVENKYSNFEAFFLEKFISLGSEMMWWYWIQSQLCCGSEQAEAAGVVGC